MLFDVVHTTTYRYADTAMEAYLEARLTPPERPTQKILRHRIEFDPAAEASSYTDYFGNIATFYSMTLRHARLKVVNRLTVRTSTYRLPAGGLAPTVSEARQILASAGPRIFDYLQPTPAVPLGGPSTAWARDLVRANLPLGDCLERLNSAIFSEFKYRSGSTDIETPLDRLWESREGVCQDFAHLMLSILRTAGIPCRYVCGYIETEPAHPGQALVGAVATHAWVEVLVPGMEWVALDPTNNKWHGEQHVVVAIGRDFLDATPVRGTFKGSASQKMKVHVTMRRIPEKP
jgi:transglutaminase-like putative cysteine protease